MGVEERGMMMISNAGERGEEVKEAAAAAVARYLEHHQSFMARQLWMKERSSRWRQMQRREG